MVVVTAEEKAEKYDIDLSQPGTYVTAGGVYEVSESGQLLRTSSVGRRGTPTVYVTPEASKEIKYKGEIQTETARAILEEASAIQKQQPYLTDIAIEKTDKGLRYTGRDTSVVFVGGQGYSVRPEDREQFLKDFPSQVAVSGKPVYKNGGYATGQYQDPYGPVSVPYTTETGRYRVATPSEKEFVEKQVSESGGTRFTPSLGDYDKILVQEISDRPGYMNVKVKTREGEYVSLERQIALTESERIFREATPFQRAAFGASMFTSPKGIEFGASVLTQMYFPKKVKKTPEKIAIEQGADFVERGLTGSSLGFGEYARGTLIGSVPGIITLGSGFSTVIGATSSLVYPSAILSTGFDVALAAGGAYYVKEEVLPIVGEIKGGETQEAFGRGLEIVSFFGGAAVSDGLGEDIIASSRARLGYEARPESKSYVRKGIRWAEREVPRPSISVVETAEGKKVYGGLFVKRGPSATKVLGVTRTGKISGPRTELGLAELGLTPGELKGLQLTSPESKTIFTKGFFEEAGMKPGEFEKLDIASEFIQRFQFQEPAEKASVFRKAESEVFEKTEFEEALSFFRRRGEKIEQVYGTSVSQSKVEPELMRKFGDVDVKTTLTRKEAEKFGKQLIESESKVSENIFEIDSAKLEEGTLMITKRKPGSKTTEKAFDIKLRDVVTEEAPEYFLGYKIRQPSEPLERLPTSRLSQENIAKFSASLQYNPETGTFVPKETRGTKDIVDVLRISESQLRSAEKSGLSKKEVEIKRESLREFARKFGYEYESVIKGGMDVKFDMEIPSGKASPISGFSKSSLSSLVSRFVISPSSARKIGKSYVSKSPVSSIASASIYPSVSYSISKYVSPFPEPSLSPPSPSPEEVPSIYPSVTSKPSPSLSPSSSYSLSPLPSDISYPPPPSGISVNIPAWGASLFSARMKKSKEKRRFKYQPTVTGIAKSMTTGEFAKKVKKEVGVGILGLKPRLPLKTKRKPLGKRKLPGVPKTIFGRSGIMKSGKLIRPIRKKKGKK